MISGRMFGEVLMNGWGHSPLEYGRVNPLTSFCLFLLPFNFSCFLSLLIVRARRVLFFFFCITSVSFSITSFLKALHVTSVGLTI